jgi:hypothetical protein
VRLGLRSGASRCCSSESGSERASASDGEDRLSGHAGAAAADVEDLAGGLIDFAERAVSAAMDPAIAAAALAFGFWRIRPFSCGNAHLHRWLPHHVFAASGSLPPGVVLPIAAAMLRRVEAYRDACRSDRRPPSDGYRFPDMTRHAEFLYGCLDGGLEQVGSPLDGGIGQAAP